MGGGGQEVQAVVRVGGVWEGKGMWGSRPVGAWVHGVGG